MKIRYHKHTITNLVINSVKEGIDAIMDNAGEIYTLAITHPIIGFSPSSEGENAPDIEGYKFIGWLYILSNTEQRTRLYMEIK